MGERVQTQTARASSKKKPPGQIVMAGSRRVAMAPVRLDQERPIQKRLPRAPDGRHEQRYVFGPGLNLERIANALYSADMGAPAMLCDLSREALQVDPHLVAILNKRFNAIASLPIKITPAAGPGINPARAKFYADVVRMMIDKIPNKRRAIKQIAWGIFDGRAALEKHWAFTPGAQTEWGQVKYSISGLGWIHPRRIFFGPERELRVVDRLISLGFSLDGLALRDFPHKFVEFTPQIFGEYPEREGLVRGALYWSFFKRIGARERMAFQELYAKPWRWAEVPADSDLGPDEVGDIDEFVEQIPGQGFGRLPRGAQFKTESPGDVKSGTIMKEVIDDSDRQLSKLVLGQTGTTDGVTAGLNSNQTAIMKDEQLQILVDDASGISEVWEDYVSDDIIETNFGREALSHAPSCVLEADFTDRDKETTRMDKALRMGLPIALRDAYEIQGYRQPDANEAIIRLETGPSTKDPFSGATVPGTATIVISYPLEEVPSGRFLAPASTVGTPAPGAAPGVATGEETEPETDENVPLIPPAELTDPDHTGDAGGDLQQSDAETSENGENPFASDYQGGVEAGNLPLPASRHMSGGISVASEATGFRLTETGVRKVFAAVGPVLAEEIISSLGAFETLTTSSIALAALNKQPKSVNGSPESIIDRAVAKFALETRGWSDKLIKSATGKDRAADILRATRDALAHLDTTEFQREFQRSTLQGEMLGALDSQYTRETDIEVAPATLALPIGSVKPGFADMSYKNALEHFNKKTTMSRADFDKLNAGAKTRAFTFARTTSQDLLKLVHAELGRMIADGVDLKTFPKFMKERVESAGWVPANASHVQTIARTNTMSAYNVGRLKDMTAPATLIARPYWQIRGVDDIRQRETHGAVNGKVFKADDPMWDKLHPPFGYNCRCRSVSLSAKQVKNRGLSVSEGSSVDGLPDKGFDGAGVRGLLSSFGL